MATACIKIIMVYVSHNFPSFESPMVLGGALAPPSHPYDSFET
jgi:hypothetical protein